MGDEDGDGYTPGRFSVVEGWRGIEPAVTYIHGDHVGAFQGIADDGSIGVTGSCGEAATAVLARLAGQFGHPSGEAVLQAIIDDPTGPDAAALP